MAGCADAWCAAGGEVGVEPVLFVVVGVGGGEAGADPPVVLEVL